MNNDLRMYSKKSFNFLQLNYDPQSKTHYLNTPEIESRTFQEYLNLNDEDDVAEISNNKTYYYILFKRMEVSEDSDKPHNTNSESHQIYNERRKLGLTKGSFIKIYYGLDPRCPECNDYGGEAGGTLVLNVIFSLSICVFMVVYFVLGLYKLCIRQEVKVLEQRAEDHQKKVDEEGEGYGRMEEIQIRAEHNVEN